MRRGSIGPPGRQGQGDGGGAGRSQQEYEKFSPDVEWMPTAVLLAKSTYVWLAQLTKQYGRPIHRLDQIPDEELDLLASRGMNSLWLIGVWERSRASQTIKQLCGNADAVASAYSLYDYRSLTTLAARKPIATCAIGASAGHPAGQRHGAEPHGNRFALGRGAS